MNGPSYKNNKCVTVNTMNNELKGFVNDGVSPSKIRRYMSPPPRFGQHNQGSQGKRLVQCYVISLFGQFKAVK